MKISELFRQLSLGELSNLSLSNSGSGTILETKHPQLILYTNTALSALHSKFVLKQQELIVELVDEITTYELISKYAQSAADDTVDFAYINDTPDNPFKDDIIRVLAVWGPTGKLPLNDPDHPRSLFTPTPLKLQVPNPISSLPLSLVYQANHPRLLDTGDNLVDQDIILPHYLDNALRKRVAAEVYSHMSGQENTMKGLEFQAAYEADCALITENDLANQSTQSSHTKLEQRGFV